jgi:hypothetical protein
MAPHVARQLRQEANLLRAFVQAYQPKFEHLIDRLNHADPASEMHSVRLCVETLAMMLANQEHLAQMLYELSADSSPGPRLAA